MKPSSKRMPYSIYQDLLNLRGLKPHDLEKRADLAKASDARALAFSGERCAEQTFGFLAQVAATGAGAQGGF